MTTPHTPIPTIGRKTNNSSLIRRLLLRCLLLIGVMLCCNVLPSKAIAEKESRTPPNVLLILVDDLGYGDLSSYGAPDLETPHIDRLVRQGMRWSRFYANCPVCSPTRAALLSGQYQEAVGVPGVIRTHAKNSWGLLSADAILLPAARKPANYSTAMFGKWHLGLAEPNLPNLRGFDYFQGYLGDMMDDYYTHRRHQINYMKCNRKTIDPPGHATDLFTEWTCRWIRKHDRQHPFFIYLPYNAPHGPIQPPADWLAKYQKKHPKVPEKRARLAALIEHLDAGIGNLLATLDQTGLANNTLVIFTSDNGGALHYSANNGALRDGKGTTYEGGIRVPMAARWPGKIEAGSSTDQLALTMDLYPTVLEAAGLATPKNIDGISLLPLLLGQTKKLPPRDLFWSRLSPRGTIHAITRGRYKLLRAHPGGPLELYDLKDDPQETTNLARTQPGVFEELRKALQAHIDRFAQVPYRWPDGMGPGEIGEPNQGPHQQSPRQPARR